MKKILIALFLLVAIAVFFLRTPDTNPEIMDVKYTSAASKFLQTRDGFRIHYRDEGNPEGEPIILLHGSGASLHMWEPLIAELGSEYRIITYTQPGHGLTGPHPRDNYSYAGMAVALEYLTRELGLYSFVLGGNSMGGWVSWRFALHNPKRVKALLLLNAYGMPLREGEEAPQLSLGFRMLQNPFGGLLTQHFMPRGLVGKAALQTVSVKEAMTQDVIDRSWELLRYPGNRRAAALRARADREDMYADFIDKVEQPTLIIWGTEDELIKATAAKTFDERMPNADVVLYKGIGHLPMLEAPRRTALDIDVFLERTVKRFQAPAEGASR